MDYKQLELLKELIDQYEWQMGHGLAVWIEYLIARLFLIRYWK